MQFDSINRRASLTSDAVAALERSIRSGRLGPGDRLPSETELARQFGISRPVVREAIAFLKGDGLVESRRGQGLFVGHLDTARLTAREIEASRSNLLEFLEFRAGLESDAVALAAERRTAADLSRLAAALDRLAAVERAGGLGADEDLDFHLAIAEAAHSFLFPKVLRFLSKPLLETMRYMRGQDELNRSYIPVRDDAHLRIFHHIEAGDAAAARTAMRTHMDATYRRYAAALSASPP